MYAAHHETVPFAQRGGFVVGFHPDTVNYCPACSRSHWYVGRMSAECAFCETALPLATAARSYGVAVSQA